MTRSWTKPSASSHVLRDSASSLTMLGQTLAWRVPLVFTTIPRAGYPGASRIRSLGRLARALRSVLRAADAAARVRQALVLGAQAQRGGLRFAQRQASAGGRRGHGRGRIGAVVARPPAAPVG